MGMTFWSGATLVNRLDTLIEPYDENHIDCNAYTLHMGQQYYLSFDGKKTSHIERLKEHGSVSIPPGQFAFLLTEEVVTIPTSVIAFISMKTDLKFRIRMTRRTQKRHARMRNINVVLPAKTSKEYQAL
jgi:dCTP deaminase